MAEPSIPVSAIRKVLADEWKGIRKSTKLHPSVKKYLWALKDGQEDFIHALEIYTGTKIRRPR